MNTYLYRNPLAPARGGTAYTRILMHFPGNSSRWIGTGDRTSDYLNMRVQDANNIYMRYDQTNQ